MWPDPKSFCRTISTSGPAFSTQHPPPFSFTALLLLSVFIQRGGFPFPSQPPAKLNQPANQPHNTINPPDKCCRCSGGGSGGVLNGWEGGFGGQVEIGVNAGQIKMAKQFSASKSQSPGRSNDPKQPTQWCARKLPIYLLPTKVLMQVL